MFKGLWIRLSGGIWEGAELLWTAQVGSKSIVNDLQREQRRGEVKGEVDDVHVVLKEEAQAQSDTLASIMGRSVIVLISQH